MTLSAIVPLSAMNSTRVLLIEDDIRDVELTLARLERANFQVSLTHVATRRDFLAAIDQRVFDVILCDFQLPGFSGIEVLEVVKARRIDVPFIFVSGVLGEENAVEMLRRGATDYIVKQRLERLPIAVNRALSEAAERRARAQAEQSLRQREAYFLQLVDSLRDYSVVALSPDGIIESWNRGSQRIFGYSADEVIGHSAEFLFPARDPFPGRDDSHPHDDAHPLLLPQVLQRVASQGSSSIERWLTRKDGTPFHGSIVITEIRDENGASLGFSHIVRDSTDSRIAADLLQATKEQAEAANMAKDQFLAVLSHELRTPLNPIALAARYLELLDDLPDGARESIDIIKRNIRIETRLIDDLLDISRIVNDKLTLNFARIDIGALLRQVGANFLAEARQSGIALHIDGGAEPLLVRGDVERLEQIISNVLKNALKFTARGGHIELRARAVDGHVEIEVCDNGIGIAADDLQRIFRAFEQGANLVSSARGGLGLGLAIAHTLAQKHGGALSAHSDGHGCGARFVLTLERERAIAEVKAPVQTPSSPPRISALRILLVEDDRDTLAAQQALLEAVGYVVTAAHSVASARRLLSENRFDVLLSDIGLPDGSGIDVLSAFRAAGGEVAIALTGYGMESDQKRLRAAGFSTHLIKPVATDSLLQLLESLSERLVQQGAS